MASNYITGIGNELVANTFILLVVFGQIGLINSPCIYISHKCFMHGIFI